MLDLPSDILEYYNQGREAGRLFRGNPLEMLRTLDLLTRYLPSAPATVLDIGGGSGVYALWLAARGYSVHLIDPVPLHVKQATAGSAAQPDHPLASIQLGDARALGFADNSVDAVLMLGPLYHLQDHADRIQAFREMYRVLNVGGVFCGAAISRFAGFTDGVLRGMLSDPAYVSIVENGLRDGKHSPNGLAYFTNTYFHHPDELVTEAQAGGFLDGKVFAIEGLAGWSLGEHGFWNDPVQLDTILKFTRQLEREPSIIGASSHLRVQAKVDREKVAKRPRKG